jgi:prepilin-type N-terminal cleavage/methylation domain-containing protein
MIASPSLHNPASSRSRGFTLIELSLSLIALGLLAVVIVQLVTARQSTRDMVREHALLERADDAVTGFAFVHWRLPCPDTSGDGLENACLGNDTGVGWLPWRTLGLADARAAGVRYGVLRSAADSSTAQSTDLATRGDRFMPLMTLGSVGGLPVASPTVLGTINNLDFCHTLRNAAALSSGGSSLLHVPGPDGNQPIAYALASPGPDGAFAAGTLDGTAVRPGAAARVFGNDDRVRVVAPEQVWDRLHCGEALASAGHANPNAASAAAILAQAALDMIQLADIQLQIADLNVRLAEASVITAAGNVAAAAAKLSLAVAQVILSGGTLSPLLVTGAILVAVKAAAAITAGVALYFVGTVKQTAEEAKAAAVALEPSIRALAVRLRANAEAADAAGLY